MDPLTGEVTLPNDHVKPTPYAVNLFQQIVGTLGWVATCHPSVACRYGELAGHSQNPSPTAFRIAKGTLKELRSEGLDPLEMVPVVDPEFRLWTDCAVHVHTGRRGWVLQLADSSWPMIDRRNIIAWRSVKDKMKHGSSTSGEVNAIQQALEDTCDHFEVAYDLLKSAKVRVLSDSMSGILQIYNGGHTFKDRARASYVNYLMRGLPYEHEGINHVSGNIQLADPLTKIKSLDWYSKTTIAN